MKLDKIEQELKKKIEKFRNAGVKINKEKLNDEEICLAILETKLKQHKETLDMLKQQKNEYMKKYRQTEKNKKYQLKYHRKYYKKNSKKILKQIKERKIKENI